MSSQDQSNNTLADRTQAERFDVANRLFLRLYQASNLLHKTGTRAVSAYGATTQQWAVLGALSRPGSRAQGMTVKQLVAFLMVSRQNLAAVLAVWARGKTRNAAAYPPKLGPNRLEMLQALSIDHQADIARIAEAA